MTYTTGLSLIEIITENEESPKAIIMAGAAGSGKSHLLKQLNLEGIKEFNPDDYVEDPDHPLYNKVGPAARQIEKEVKAAAESKKKIRFIWDTTAAGTDFDKTLDKLLSVGYDVYIVMAYTHPMISYASNFNRNRKVPSVAIFKTWRNAYQKIDRFKNKLKGNFSIHVNNRDGDYDNQVRDFDNAAKNGVEGIKNYLRDYNEKTGAGRSTFFTPVKMTREEEKAFEKAVINIDFDRENRVEGNEVKKEFLKSFRETGTGPGEDKLRSVVERERKKKGRTDRQNDEVLDDILNMLDNRRFRDLIQSENSSIEEIDNKIQNFLK